MTPTVQFLEGDCRETLKTLADECVQMGLGVPGCDLLYKPQPKRDGRFKPGTHWRKPKPFWERDWLWTQYVVLKKPASEIAREQGCDENNILFWLAKHGLQRRSMVEIRKIKHWGLSGEKNGMFGCCGQNNPHWRGGLTPARQRIYSRVEWRRAYREVRARDKCCRLCGATSKFHLHHIDPFCEAPLMAMDPGNLILLCVKCHNRIRGKEKRWKKRLFNLISEKGG